MPGLGYRVNSDVLPQIGAHSSLCQININLKPSKQKLCSWLDSLANGLRDKQKEEIRYQRMLEPSKRGF